MLYHEFSVDIIVSLIGLGLYQVREKYFYKKIDWLNALQNSLNGVTCLDQSLRYKKQIKEKNNNKPIYESYNLFMI